MVWFNQQQSRQERGVCTSKFLLFPLLSLFQSGTGPVFNGKIRQADSCRDFSFVQKCVSTCCWKGWRVSPPAVPRAAARLHPTTPVLHSRSWLQQVHSTQTHSYQSRPRIERQLFALLTQVYLLCIINRFWTIPRLLGFKS